MSDLAASMSRLSSCIEEIDLLSQRVRQGLLDKSAEIARMQEPAIGKADAAKILGIGVSTLEKRVKKPNPPPHYIDGGKVVFYASELRAWMREYRVGRVPDIG